jgi:hypothetical protein
MNPAKGETETEGRWKDGSNPGLPDGLFPNPTPSFGKFWNAFERIILISFLTVWYTLWPFASFYGHLVHVVAIYYIIPLLVNCIKKNLATLFETVTECGQEKQSSLANAAETLFSLYPSMHMYICMYIGVSNPLSMQMLTKACVLNFLNE